MSVVKMVVIGVLTQDISVGQENKFGDDVYTCSLGASYVKFIEDCGGNCLPIAQNQKPEYYDNIVSMVHAVILPGGGPHLCGSKGYTASGILLLDALTSAAERGRVIPVFGICLGYELMAVYFGSTENVLSDVLTKYYPSVTGWKELDFPDVFPSLIPPQQFDKLKKNALVNFLHEMCITLETFNTRLNEEWQVLATNDLKTREIYEGVEKDSRIVSRGETLTAVTMMESKSRPYFGVQFHPEKTRHFSTQREKCPDIAKAEIAAEVFISVLMGIIKAQNISFAFPEDELERLIDRFTPEDVRSDNTIQLDYVYMFREGDLMVNFSPSPS